MNRFILTNLYGKLEVKHMNKMKYLIATILGLFLVSSLIVLFFETNEPKGILTYYFKNPQLVDPVPNATQELYLTGELEVGRCYKYE